MYYQINLVKLDLKGKGYIPTNTSNGFSGSESLVNIILDKISSSNWVTCKKN